MCLSIARPEAREKLNSMSLRTWGLLEVPHFFLDILKQERRGSKVVHGKAEKALYFLLVKIHSDNVS